MARPEKSRSMPHAIVTASNERKLHRQFQRHCCKVICTKCLLEEACEPGSAPLDTAMLSGIVTVDRDRAEHSAAKAHRSKKKHKAPKNKSKKHKVWWAAVSLEV